MDPNNQLHKQLEQKQLIDQHQQELFMSQGYEQNHELLLSTEDTSFVNQVFSNFILGHLQSPRLPLCPKSHFEVRQAVFAILDRYHLQMFNVKIDDILALREHEDDVVFSKTECVHHLIAKLNRIVQVLLFVVQQEMYVHNVYIFLPYLRQLKQMLSNFVNDYCCSSVVQKCIQSVDSLMQRSTKYLEAIKFISDRLLVMNVFDDSIKIYQCNICQNTSVEEHFLKPDTCCGYRICFACYSQLWQYCNVYPVCPVCKTSFKKSNANNKKLNDALDSSTIEEE
ncbi:IE-0 [Clanis bilineata nucleopolyhedrovirus]|uniref:IE-0 n=1 Tax=Clanis bilineata nucleopolyhedrovirus TaxID=1307957 RepID=Q0N487_9ABAC|nr:IE-0 [Clanis bilineata nucleopolyhedrovirus]ABF47356.1 IE-0 [Clanis bilineata nucleopolyhedrovirus]